MSLPPDPRFAAAAASSSRRALRGDATYHTAAGDERRPQTYASHAEGARRGSLKPPQTAKVGARPNPTIRTQSAPLVPRRDAAAVARPRYDDQANDAFRLGHDSDADSDDEGADASDDGRDFDEYAGVGSFASFQPFQAQESSERLPEINIAVIGADKVGKSTFVQKAFNLPHLPPSHAAECRMPVDGSTYLVRLLELAFDDIDINDDDTVSWPDVIENKRMPRVDGALALYDVKDKRSVEDLPEMLKAITKTSLPTVLVSCKCDVQPANREVDPAEIEYKAKRAIGNLATLQISRLNPENHRRGVFSLVRAIINDGARASYRPPTANRRRAQSNANRPVSPRPPGPMGHSRASSEYTLGPLKDQVHFRHDSSLAHLRVPSSVEDPMQNQNSFLLEASTSDSSGESEQSFDGDDSRQAAAGASSTALSDENGVTFDDLVDRLLAQPASKTDHRFAVMFLALYRKFAAPGRLLEVLVDRFDQLERDGSALMIKTFNQMRYMAILEQWVNSYPGDFAFPKTKRRLWTFVSKLADTRIYAAAAKEIGTGLEVVRVDDDTHWACCDRDRETSGDLSRSSISSSASTLIDDPSYIFRKLDLSGSTLNEDARATADITSHLKQSNQFHVDVEAARKQAQQFEPSPREPLTKIQWRAFMDCPDDLVAKELTRMDWAMFLSIRPRDLIRYVSLPKDQHASCENLVHVTRMADHFNHLATWVANYVLLRDKPRHRALMLEKFMRVARKVRELNNYNALGAIIAGVKSSAVHRLAATAELIPPAVGRDWLKLEILMAPSRSHSSYRMAWDNSTGERIPYLPLHRRDLAGAEEGNRTFVGDEREGRVNWRKFRIIGDVIVSMQRAQDLPYRELGRPDAVVRELLLEGRLVTDEEELYERSLQCEPAAGSSNTTSAKFRDFFKR